jgi:hypothetical protein
MNQQEYFEFHKTMCDRAREISAAKNNDYSAPQKRGDDPFAVFGNFMQAEHLNICTVEQGLCIRLSDKLSRLCNLLAPGHNQTVKDESVQDTALDTINYLLLLLGYLETKRRQQGLAWRKGAEARIDSRSELLGKAMRLDEQIAEDLKPPPEVDEHFSKWFAEWLRGNRGFYITSASVPGDAFNPFGGVYRFVISPNTARGELRTPQKEDWVEVLDADGSLYYPRAALKQYEHEARSAYVAQAKEMGLL